MFWVAEIIISTKKITLIDYQKQNFIHYIVLQINRTSRETALNNYFYGDFINFFFLQFKLI